MELSREIVMSRWLLAFNFNMAWLIRYLNFTWPRLNIEEKHMKIPQTMHKLFKVLPFTLFIGQWKPCHNRLEPPCWWIIVKKKCVVLNWGQFSLWAAVSLVDAWGGRHNQPFCCGVSFTFSYLAQKDIIWTWMPLKNMTMTTKYLLLLRSQDYVHWWSYLKCSSCLAWRAHVALKKSRTQCR